jgi:hypothetical protein
MANPSFFTINNLTANASVTQPTADTVDTTGTVPIRAGSLTSRMIVEVINGAGVGLTVAVKAGNNPPAVRAGLGDLSVSLAASGSAGDKKIIGPFESARFAQGNGDVNLSFSPVSGSPNATVRVYHLPKG